MTGTGSQTLLRAPAAAAGTLRCCPRLRARLGSAAPGLLSPLRGVNASPGMEQKKSRALSGQRADRVIYLGGKVGPRDIVLRERKLLPLFQLFRKLRLCLGEEKPLCTRDPVPAWLCGWFFSADLFLHPSRLPRHCRAPGAFPGCYFSARPGVRESSAPPGWSGESPAGASLRGDG